MSTITTAVLGATAGAVLSLTAVLAVTGTADAHPTQGHNPTLVCARAAFTADDYAHTHTGARAERQAVAACAAQVGGF
jgi:hypothetical protein